MNQIANWQTQGKNTVLELILGLHMKFNIFPAEKLADENDLQFLHLLQRSLAIWSTLSFHCWCRNCYRYGWAFLYNPMFDCTKFKLGNTQSQHFVTSFQWNAAQKSLLSQCCVLHFDHGCLKVLMLKRCSAISGWKWIPYMIHSIFVPRVSLNMKMASNFLTVWPLYVACSLCYSCRGKKERRRLLEWVWILFVRFIGGSCLGYSSGGIDGHTSRHQQASCCSQRHWYIPTHTLWVTIIRKNLWI